MTNLGTYLSLAIRMCIEHFKAPDFGSLKMDVVRHTHQLSHLQGGDKPIIICATFISYIQTFMHFYCHFVIKHTLN